LQYDVTSDRFIFYASYDGTNFNGVTANNFGSLSTGTWYYVAAWYDGSGSLNIQVNNGTPNTTGWAHSIYDGTADFEIGGRNDNGGTFANGRIDEVSFWKRMLTATERAALYDSGAGCQYPLNACTLESYVYDGDGNLVKSTENGVITAYIGDYYEWNGSAGVKYYYANGSRVAVRNAAGTLYFLLNDHLGSMAATADSSGNFYGEDMYEPWGPIRYTGGTIPTSYTFTGARRETGVGALYYFGSRWYDQWIGRFLSADSIVPGGNPQALNRYSYAFNNPMRYMDPTGHMPCASCEGGGGEYTPPPYNTTLPGVIQDRAKIAVESYLDYLNFIAGLAPAFMIGAVVPGGGGEGNAVQAPEQGGPGVQLALPGFEISGDYGGPLAEHATMRQELGLPPAGTKDAAVLTKLEIGDNTFWGINAHGQDVSAWKDLRLVNAGTLTHAEGEAFNQAAEAGVVGGHAHLYVDSALCDFCGRNGGVRSMARFLELQSLTVTTPFGTYDIPLP
jgi:RHS repeat-associated protein